MSHDRPAIELLDPSSYRHVPWKNGGGVTIDIAGAFRTEAEPGSWSGTIWRLGRTRIERAGPFSDLAGFDRILAVIDGRGLRLRPKQAPALDVRDPMRPVRFPGDWAVDSELEAGPVGVLNLIADRARVAIDLVFARSPAALAVEADTVVIYAPDGPAGIVLDGEIVRLASDGAVRIEGRSSLAIEVVSGYVAVATISIKA